MRESLNLKQRSPKKKIIKPNAPNEKITGAEDTHKMTSPKKLIQSPQKVQADLKK